MDLKTFLSKIARAFPSDVDNTHFSVVYVRTDLIKFFCNMTLPFHESSCDFN
jgi:hypothetical protein